MAPLLTDLSSHPLAVWLVAALGAGILEILLPSFSFIFGAFGAVLAAISALRFGWAVQAAVFALGTLLGLVLLRGRFLERFQSRAKIHSRERALVGKPGVITESTGNADRLGRVVVDGQDWAAHSGTALAAGTSVIVEGSDGIVLQVSPLIAQEEK